MKKPDRYIWVYTYEADEHPEVKWRELLVYKPTAEDSDAVLPGLQNAIDLASGIEFRKTSPEVLLMALPALGNTVKTPRFEPDPVSFELRNAGGVDSVEQFWALEGPNALDIVVDDFARMDDEWVRVLAVSPDDPQIGQSTYTVRRGLFSPNSPPAHLFGSKFVVQRLNLQQGFRRVLVPGPFAGLLAPENFKATAVTDGILIEWDHFLSDPTDPEERRNRKGFVIHKDIDSGTVAADYDGDPIVVTGPNGIDTRVERGFNTFFQPKDAQGRVVTGVEYFFRVAAVARSNDESPLSAEDSATIQATTIPRTDGPPTPVVSVVKRGHKFQLAVKAKIPTNLNPGEAIANITHARIELYQGSTPSTVAVPTDPLVAGANDNQRPYEQDTNVAALGLGTFWGRAYFADSDGQVGAWGLSSVFALSEIANTPDVDVPQTPQLAITPFELNGLLSVQLFGFAGSEVESAVESQYQIRLAGDGTYDATSGFSNPLRDVDGLPYPLRHNVSISPVDLWEVIVRFRNAHGWSLWTAPIEMLVLVDDTLQRDSAVHALAEFHAATMTAPHPVFGTGGLTGLGVMLRHKLGTVDRNTVWKLQTYGHSSLPFPTENVTAATGTAKTRADNPFIIDLPGAGLVVDAHIGEVFRVKSGGTHLLQDILIVDNDATSITVSGQRPYVENQTTLLQGEWEIVQTPLRGLVDFYHEKLLPILSGRLPVGIDDFREFVPLQPGQDYFYMSLAHNLRGEGPLRASDATAAGTAILSQATKKVVSGIDGAAEVVEKSIGSRQQSFGSQQFIEDLDPQPVNNVRWTWPTFNLEFPETGQSFTISAGDSGNLVVGAVYYHYWRSSAPATLQKTTVRSTASGDDRVMITRSFPIADSNELIGVLKAQGGGVTTAANILANFIAALAQKTGKLQVEQDFVLGEVDANGDLVGGGIILRRRPGLQNGDGIIVIDDQGNTRIEIPIAGSNVYDICLAVSGSNPGVIRFSGLGLIFGNTTALGISPETDGTHVLALGAATALRWDVIQAFAKQHFEFKFPNAESVRVAPGILALQPRATPGAMTAPGPDFNQVYFDSADGDLKVRFANGTIKTIATD